MDDDLKTTVVLIDCLLFLPAVSISVSPFIRQRFGSLGLTLRSPLPLMTG